MKIIPYGRQNITLSDIISVINVLRGESLTQGPAVDKFELAVSEYVGVKFGVALNSATSALHVACRALDIGPGDLVWTSPISFVASANCALYCGAEVDFIDIDPKSYNLDISKLKSKLDLAKNLKRLPNLLIVVHLAGQSCDMEEISILSKKYNFKIIEDASHCIGGEYKNKKVGNSEFSDISVFSFHPVKIITTGEGGMALTNSSSLAAKMKLLRSHGITKNPSDMIRKNFAGWYYEQQELGFNYRITDIQAALGLSQLRRIEENIKKRHKIAAIYDESLKSLPVIIPWQSQFSYSSYHLYIIRLKLDKLNKSRDEIFSYMRANGIAVNLHYMPIYRQPFYAKTEKIYCEFPESERYFSEAMTLPIYPKLNVKDQRRVIDVLIKALNL